MLLHPAVAVLVVLAPSFAQQPAPLENTGKPMRVSAGCTAEMVNALGLQCSSSEPCPIFLEIAGVDAAGNRIIAAGNLHTSAATIESILLASDDGGKTWTEPYARIPAGALDRIQFIDFETGWVSGHLLQPVARDAFFLITGDGGKTWRRRPLFGETRTGAIDEFLFESRTRGSMLVDRLQSGDEGMHHELYETETGGESWSLRQVDRKPIALGRKRLPPDWRARADAPSKSYRIERRGAADKWQPVASFLVAAGECKPAEAAPAPVEPPPEPAPEPPPPPSSKRPAKPPSLRR